MSANATFTELVTTTFRKHKKQIADNVSNRVAFLKYMFKRGNKVLEDGGLTIVCPLDYAENSTYQRYSDWDILNISASDVISAAEYQWRQIALNVVASGRELRINSGRSQILKLSESRLKNAIRTYNNNFSSDLYSDGSLTNQINGLQALISDVNTNTVGGIDANTWSFWQNKVRDASDNGITVNENTIEKDMMLPMWLSLERGMDDAPDVIVMDSTYYQYFENSQTSLKRYIDQKNVAGGLPALAYKSADVLFENSSAILANHGYFINTQYLKLCVHRQADLEVMDDMRPINQEGSVTPILWMGNLVVSNRSQQGVIKT